MKKDSRPLFRPLLPLAGVIFSMVFILGCPNDRRASREPTDKDSTAGAHTNNPDSRPADIAILVVDVELVEKVLVEDAGDRFDRDRWRNFVGVMKCKVVSVETNRTGHDISTGMRINVVVSRNDVTDHDFVATQGDTGSLEVKSQYRLRLTDQLPPGWSPIAEEFDDVRIGLAACLSIQRTSARGG